MLQHGFKKSFRTEGCANKASEKFRRLRNNKLIATGGYGYEAVDMAEIYDETEDKWYRLRTMNRPRCGSLMFVSFSCFGTNT